LRRASASVAPDSTSWRTAKRIFWKTRFSCCEPRISRHCTSGRPASIITENWRVKIAISLREMLPPIFGRANSFPFSVTPVTVICCLRSTLMTASLLSATRTPSCVFPARVRPFHA
jgi:hypothetical protein